ncbi:hypothetical protein OH458_21680, partial [Vibrio sp. MarTm2]|uniref:hypothetical protein n=1 Tax=Vibrio sp. MarTm2 TaxID=2998831 RepID=UPI0022CDA430
MMNTEQNPVIPAEIVVDMTFVGELIKDVSRKSESLNIDISPSIEAVCSFEFDGSASGIVIDTGKHFQPTQYDLHHVIYTYLTTTGDNNIIQLHSVVDWKGVEPKTFSCEFDVATSKGIPSSVYEAYAYLSASSTLSKGEMIEIFGGATCCLAALTFYDYFCEVEKPKEDFYFSAIDAILNDLEASGISVA